MATPEYPQRPGVYAVPPPPDLPSRTPVLLAPPAPAWDDPYHQHTWGTNLRCQGCGWTYHAVLARMRAAQEEPPCP